MTPAMKKKAEELREENVGVYHTEEVSAAILERIIALDTETKQADEAEHVIELYKTNDITAWHELLLAALSHKLGSGAESILPELGRPRLEDCNAQPPTTLAPAELLPCPWCQSTPVVESNPDGETVTVACVNEGCANNPFADAHTKTAAITAWNRRVPPVSTTLVETRALLAHSAALREHTEQVLAAASRPTYPAALVEQMEAALRAIIQVSAHTERHDGRATTLAALFQCREYALAALRAAESAGGEAAKQPTARREEVYPATTHPLVNSERKTERG